MNGVPDHPELLLRERDWLVALAKQLVQRHELAGELAHDALAAACTQRGPVTAGPRAWLASILKKRLAGERRADHRRRAREAQAARPEAVPPAGDTVARFEVQRDVADAVLALSEPYRTTVLLRFWDELSPAAIARRTAVPVETVRTRLKRGLAQLRERLDRAHGGDRRAWAVPLWAAGQTNSFAAFLAGVSLMTAMHKFAACGIAAAALFAWMAWDWSTQGAKPAPSTRPTESRLVANVRAAATQPSETPANDRVPLASPEDVPALVVTGRVIDDETDAPLAGARVQLVGSSAGRTLGIEQTSASDGTFTLREASLPASDGRMVLVEAGDYAPQRAHASFERERKDQQRIDIGSIRTVRGAVLSGQVVDAEGRAIADADLFMAWRGLGYAGHGPQNTLELPMHVGRSDAAGRFRLAEPVAPDINRPNLLFAVATEGVGWCGFETSKQRREVTDLVIRLQPGGDVDVLVQDATGLLVAGAEVRALPRFSPIGMEDRRARAKVSPDARIDARFTGRTDGTGHLRLNLPVGERSELRSEPGHERLYDLMIAAPGYPLQPLQPCHVVPGTGQPVVVRLVAARNTPVSVDVVDDIGSPIAGATVTAAAEHPIEARTDAAGHAELAVLATSRIMIACETPHHREVHMEVSVESGAPVHLNLTLARTHALDGRVVDQFGAPAAGMFLFVDGRHVGETAADGSFHVDAFPMGSRELVVALGSMMDRTRWIGEQSPKTVDAERGPVTITMQRRLGNVDVSIAIVDAASRQPLEPSNVMLAFCAGPRGHYEQKSVQVKLGSVEATDCVAGRWQLCVRSATGQRGSLEFTLTDGQPRTELRLELALPGAIAGRLRFAGVSLPASVTMDVGFATHVSGVTWTGFRFPGRWQLDAASQTVSGTEFGATGTLHLEPARNPAFRLESADPTDTLVFTVRGEGVTGEARVRIAPGETREIVIDVQPPRVPR